MKLILDTEVTRSKHPITGKDDPSPYNPNNKLVTVQYKILETGEKDCVVLNHAQQASYLIGHEKVQDILNKATQIIGHNLKFDISWLLECGFKLPEGIKLYDTMIFEYVCQKGIKQPLSMASLAEKYSLPLKLDILQNYWEKGINTDEVPLAELKEYAIQDIDTTEALYLNQRQRYANDSDVKFMWPAIQLTNEALSVVIEMERNGCKIDTAALDSVEKAYTKELQDLEKGLRTTISELMGDTPINLSSPDDMTKVLYGFEVKNKEIWAKEFNIGTQVRNGVKKKKYPPKVSPNKLREMVRNLTVPIYKTKAEQCSHCFGKGKIRKIKKSGEEYKKENICSFCEGEGLVYHETSKRAGLRLPPLDVKYVTSAGFATDKHVIEEYLQSETISEEVKVFLKALQKQSAIENYLSTFVYGIKNNIREDLLLHTNLNQCVTATGRLSSSGPNFQNLPRGSTFPVRKAIVSRFGYGSILEVDFSGLEYRVAVMLADCPAGLASIIEGKDRHQITAEILFDKKKEDYSSPKEYKEARQEAKSRTFKPLYGGETGTDKEQAYFTAFMEEHYGIKKYQENLCNAALENGQITTPFHRIFSFQNTYRQTNGKVKGKTQIVNYPVQSAATADIIWVTLVEIYKQFKLLNLQSKLILQVHDAVLVDVHPEEVKIVINILKETFDKVQQLIYTRYQYSTKVPLAYEAKIGDSWGNLTEI